MTPMKPMKPMAPMTPMQPMKPSSIDAPEEWGEASSTGGQSDVHYAYYPKPRRLIVERNGTRSTYDTADHEINGVSQDQSDVRAGRLVFTSQHGPIALESLNAVDE